jgi:hypothetical protein
MRELARVARRDVMVLEYAREHVDTPARRSIMQQASWHGHWFTASLEGAGLHVVDAFPFPSFASDLSRIPLSLFRATKAEP